MTTSPGTDSDDSTAEAWTRRPSGARFPRPGQGREAPDAPKHVPERPHFGTVVRGYDRSEVDRYIGEIQRQVTTMRSELAGADDRRRRAERRVESLESDNRAVRARLDSAATPAAPDEGFGVRAEKLLRMAEQEAAEVRSDAVEEVAALRQQVREDVERQRHEAEQALIARSAQFDEHASRRSAELQRREQQISEQLTTARGEADALQAAARRSADHYRQRVEADVEQVKTRVGAEVAQIREQAGQELDRLATLESGVRAELRRLSARLAQEIARQAPRARDADGTDDRETDSRNGGTSGRRGSGSGGAPTPADARGARAEAHR